MPQVSKGGLAVRGPLTRRMATLHERCIATTFVNDSALALKRRRRRFAADEAMARLWIERMLQLAIAPIFVMHNAGNDATRVLGPFLNSTRVHLVLVDLVLVDTPGTLPWYRLTHTKLQAWGLPCRTVALWDYDGMPLHRPMDDIFDACEHALSSGAAPADVPRPASFAASSPRRRAPAPLTLPFATAPTLCAVEDRKTPYDRSNGRKYLNSGLLVLRPNRTVHAWLLEQVCIAC